MPAWRATGDLEIFCVPWSQCWGSMSAWSSGHSKDLWVFFPWYLRMYSTADLCVIFMVYFSIFFIFFSGSRELNKRAIERTAVRVELMFCNNLLHPHPKPSGKFLLSVFPIGWQIICVFRLPCSIPIDAKCGRLSHVSRVPLTWLHYHANWECIWEPDAQFSLRPLSPQHVSPAPAPPI